MIRQMPGAFLGTNSISAMYSYLHGFRKGLYRLGEEDKGKTLLPLPFHYFHEYVSSCHSWHCPTAGWCNIILKGNNFDEEKSLDVFFELFSKFISLSIQSCQYAKLDSKAILYHSTDERAPKLLLPPDYEQTKPLYLNPTEIFLFELPDTGYLPMVNTATQHRLERIFKNENEAKSFVKHCFGSTLNWNDIRIENYNFTMEFLSY